MALNFSRCNRPLTRWVCLSTSSRGDNCNAWYVMRYHVVASSQVSAFLPLHLRRPSAACDQSSQRYNVCTRPTHLPGRIHPHYCPVGGITHICNSSGHYYFIMGVRIRYLIAIRRGDATNNYNNHGGWSLMQNIQREVMDTEIVLVEL